ncbi:hypothetical protein KDA10_00845 [candidate division WWE3 bacterium]|uniref:Uncharacterized protein n=1 Tax=candidate division WWE3 bacterium TaxID=2053526 RepID=A0A955E0T9_UNCKA|nr:hypothetical protein [candidate division WWE3 bacterium]
MCSFTQLLEGKSFFYLFLTFLPFFILIRSLDMRRSIVQLANYIISGYIGVIFYISVCNLIRFDFVNILLIAALIFVLSLFLLFLFFVDMWYLNFVLYFVAFALPLVWITGSFSLFRLLALVFVLVSTCLFIRNYLRGKI